MFLLAVVITTKLAIANAVTTEQVPTEVKLVSKTPLVGHKIDSKALEMYKTMIDSSAQKYGVESQILTSIINCESSFDRYAVNDSPKEFSVGLSQINLQAHTNITRQQAEDPEFAIDFMASNVAKGNGPSMWVTCYSRATS